MALSTVSPFSGRSSLHSFQCLKPSLTVSSPSPLLHGQWDSKTFDICPSSIHAHHRIVVYSGGSDGIETGRLEPCLLDDDLLKRVAAAKDARQALEIITEAKTNAIGGTVDNDDCRRIIEKAIEGRNVDLALSVFHAMLSGRAPGMDGGATIDRWGWARPNVQTYSLLVLGLAACLRVADALTIIGLVSGASATSGDEVPFGMIVQCPICMLAIAVAQPQHGVQIASCSKCRYQYELVSGDIHSIDSEVARICYCRTQHEYISMGEGFEAPSCK